MEAMTIIENDKNSNKITTTIKFVYREEDNIQMKIYTVQFT